MELFHSNMLEYLALSFPEAAKTVLSLRPDPSQKETSVERERRHLDLIVKLSGRRSLVIENKLFDFPRAQQLIDYKQGLPPALRESSLVLLSLMDPPTGGMPAGWEHLSYGELGRRLMNRFASTADFSRQLMEHWGQLCVLLQELAGALGLRDDPRERFDLSSVVVGIQELEEARLRPFAVKLRAHQLLHRITDALGSDAGRFALASGYTNGSALLEGFVTLNDEDEVGWQLQGNQWRLAVRMRKDTPLYGRGEALRKGREDRVRQRYIGHMDFSLLDEWGLTTAGGEGRRKFLHFAPDFVYQRRILVDPTVGQLVELAARTSRRRGYLLRSGTPTSCGQPCTRGMPPIRAFVGIGSAATACSTSR